MGEANLRFVRGDRDTAVRMCMEVIRQVSQYLYVVVQLIYHKNQLTCPRLLDNYLRVWCPQHG